MSFLGQLTSVYIPSFRFSDIIEIYILIFLIYKVIIGLRNTRAMVILKGILILFIFYNIAYLFSFQAILVLFQSAITLCIFAVIVVFQAEMRKFLEQIGTKNIAGKLDILSLLNKRKEDFKYYSDKSIVELSKACFAMGEVKTGALIVIEREIPLSEYIETGIMLNADLSYQLILNTFEKNTPLHDGAAIQIRDKIIAATCYLPLSQSSKISKNMGTRHRAAVGVSEVTDSLVIVVSEEVGHVSLVVDGKINYNLSKEELTSLLYQYQVKKEVGDVLKEKEKVSIKEYFNKEKLVPQLVSIVVGIASWVLLMNIANPITTVTFTDIPIEVINTSVIESIGKTYEITSENYVDVCISDRRSIVDKIKKEDVSVIADLTKLSYVNAAPLQGFVEKYPTAKVDFKDDNTITVELDSIISKEVTITLDKYLEDVSTTYVPILDSEIESIIITGGKSNVEKIDKIVYIYDVTDASDFYTGTAEPIVYDKNGDVLNNDLFEFSNYTVTAYGQAYKIKEIPLDITLDRQIVSGYKIEGVDFIPKSILVAGEEKQLANLNKLSISLNINLDIDKISNNKFVKSISISDNLPTGVYFVGDSDEILVTLSFEPLKTKIITFKREDISLLGLLPDYNASIEDSTFSIIISGEDSVLSKISKDTIIPYIDMSGLSEGKYNMIMQFDGLDSAILTSNLSIKLSVIKK